MARKRLKRRVKRRPKRKLRFPRRIRNDNRILSLHVISKAAISITPAGTNAFATFSIPVNFPTMIRNNSNTYAQIANGGGLTETLISPVWIRLFNAPTMFDEYRVRSLTVTFIPAEMQNQSTAVGYDTVDTPSVMYSYIDYDDTVLMANEGQCLNAGILPKSYVVGKPIKWTIRPMGIRKTEWFNTSAYNQVETAAIIGSTTLPLAAYRCLKLGLPLTQAAGVCVPGRLYMDWDCDFRSLTNIAV